MNNRTSTGFLVSPVEFEDDASANLDFLQLTTAEKDAQQEAAAAAAAAASSDDDEDDEDDADADDSHEVQEATNDEATTAKSESAAATESATRPASATDSNAETISTDEQRLLEARRAAQAAAIEFLTVAQNMDASAARKEILGTEASAADGSDNVTLSSPTAASAGDDAHARKRAQFSEKVSVMPSGEKKQKRAKRAGKEKAVKPAKFVLNVDVTDETVLFDLETVVALIKADPIVEQHMSDVTDLLLSPYKHERVISQFFFPLFVCFCCTRVRGFGRRD